MTAGAFIVVAVVLGIAAVSTVQILAGALTDGVRVSVEQDLETIGARLETSPSAGRTLDDIGDDVLVRLVGSSTVVNDEDAAALPSVSEDSTRRVVVDGDAYLVGSDDTDAGVLTVARPLEHVDDAVSTATVLLAVGVPLVLALMAVVVWVVAGRALAPVERLRRQVDGIGATDLSHRVDAGDDELGALAETMNRMLARIEHAQSVQRRFVSDASHELRSPLATMRQHAELAHAHPDSTSLDELGRVVRDEGARMQDLVEGLLLLARLDEHQQPPFEPVDLDDLALEEAARLRGMGVHVDTTSVGAGRVLGAPPLLARAVRNLVDNAARHADRAVTLRVAADGPVVRLEVEDDGAGILPEDRLRVFDRFARLDEGRARDEGGSGLGLAIVREVAEVHHGTVAVDAGAGGGARFMLALPAAPSA
ncbi:sensor histidine kinase [Microbacterium sp. 22195]|uniref:sensor histidine kinase n=1 Tax=Microbacterium sp. 22195 TaxID=3453891 RepID=UPI003F8616CD